MTEAAHPEDHDAAHEGPIRTRKQLVLTLFWATRVLSTQQRTRRYWRARWGRSAIRRVT